MDILKKNDGDSYELEFVGEQWNGSRLVDSLVIELFSERTMGECHRLIEKYFPIVEEELKEEHPNMQLVVRMYRS